MINTAREQNKSIKQEEKNTEKTKLKKDIKGQQTMKFNKEILEQ